MIKKIYNTNLYIKKYMTIKFLKIDGFLKFEHLTLLSDLFDIEVLTIVNLDVKISEISKLNLPFNLKHLIVDLILREEDGKTYANLEFNSYSEAVLYIKDFSNKFKIPFGCILTFRFNYTILEIKHCCFQFIISNNKIIYDSFEYKFHTSKMSTLYLELQQIINEQINKYKKDEIFRLKNINIKKICNLIK